MIDIGKLRAICDAATPGPWKPSVWIETDGNEWRATGPGHEEHAIDHGSEPGCPDELAARCDAAFIAAARNALPAALDEIERLRAEVSGYEECQGTLAICVEKAAKDRADLRIALEQVTRERDVASRRVLTPLSLADVKEALNEGAAESRAASGDNAWSSLLKQRDAAIADRDQLRTALEEAVSAAERQEKFCMSGLENRAAKAERDTAERIAAWLDNCERIERASGPPYDGADVIRDVASHIRAGAWRKDPG